MKSLIKRIFSCALATTLIGCSSSSGGSTVVESTPTPSTTPVTETVELTIDNWQDYFEVKEMVFPSYNEFDEVEQISNYVVFALKDGMTFEENSNPEVAIEYSYENKFVGFTDANFEGMSVTYDELTDENITAYGWEKEYFTTNATDTTTLRLYDFNDTPNKYLYSYDLEIWYSHLDDNQNPVVYGRSDLYGISSGSGYLGDFFCVIPNMDTFTITRIKGTIEIVKEN